MDSLSSAGTHKAISLNAHCLADPNHPMLVSICLAREKTRSRALSLDGVRHGMEIPADRPVMVRRPYQEEATPLDDATDLTVAI